MDTSQYKTECSQPGKGKKNHTAKKEEEMNEKKRAFCTRRGENLNPRFIFLSVRIETPR